jgi:hypothetical protein
MIPMLRMCMCLLVLLFIVGEVWAQEFSDFDPNNPQATSPFLNPDNTTGINQERPQSRPPGPQAPLYRRVLGGDESLRIEEIDSERGIPLGTFSTADDRSRITASFSFNSDLKDLSTISSFQGAYAFRLRKTWIELSGSKTVARYNELTRENPSIPGANIANLELENTDLLSFGAGLLYRTTYIQNIFNGPSFFETVSAAITYNQFDDSVRSETYSGLGFKAEFGVHRRFSKNFHFGGKLSYHLASVQYPDEGNELTKSERSLLLTWMGLGFDLGFYF